MDQATIMRILERQGAENTPDNINRIIQFAASDPSILERYSMGTAPRQQSSGPGRQDIRGSSGLDDNASLLNLRGQQPTIDRNRSTVTTEPAPAPVARRAAPARPGIPGDFNRPTGAPPFPTQQQPPGVAYEPSTGAPIPVPSGMAESRAVPPDAASAGGQGGSGWDWLMAMAGLRALQKPGEPQLPPPFKGGPSVPPDALRITQQPPEAVYAGRMPRSDVDVQRTGRTGGMPETTPGLPPPPTRIVSDTPPTGQMRPPPPAGPQVEAPPARPGITGGNPPVYPSGAPQMDTRGGIDLENQRIQDELDMKEQIAKQNAANKPPDVVRPGKRTPKPRAGR